MMCDTTDMTYEDIIIGVRYEILCLTDSDILFFGIDACTNQDGKVMS